MTVIGLRPDDVVTDTAGNVKPGVTLGIYDTQAHATAGGATGLLASPVTDTKGRWSADVAGSTWWVRLPSGDTYELADWSTKLDLATANSTFATQAATGIDASKQAGATDNAKVSAAISGASSFGGRVVIPPAAYTWTSGVTLPPVTGDRGIEIYAVGATITHTGNDYAFTFGNGGATDARYHKIVGAKILGSSSGLGAVQFNNTRFCKVLDCDISGYTAAARVVSVLGGVSNYFNVIKGNRVRDGVVGVYLDGGGAGIGANSNYVQENHLSVLTTCVMVDAGDANRISLNEYNGSSTNGCVLQGAAVGNTLMGNQHDGVTNSITIGAGVTDTYIFGDTGGGTYSDSGTGTVRIYSGGGIKTTGIIESTTRLRSTGLFNPGGNCIILDSSQNPGLTVRSTDVQFNKAAMFTATGNGAQFNDSVNLFLGSTTGTKIGTAATQKLAFYGATPIVQPSSTPAAATDLATALTLLNDLRTKLLALGVIA